ncbi:potassium channel family protein [Spirochaetota bacterium]
MKRLRLSLILLICTIIMGVVGYYFIEGIPIFDSLYMTIITMSTVGFREIRPLSIYGRTLTIFIIITGITIGAYTIGTLVRMIIEGEIRKSLGRRKMERKISDLNGHFIVCGFGRIGSLICEELNKYNEKFVVIENDPDAILRLEASKYLYLQSDASTDESLREAGIMKARAIVTAVRSDADNVYITLTAKQLRPDLFILSRASEIKNEEKLRRAGASRVVSPYYIGGKRMAHVLLRPAVIDFIDIVIMDNPLGLQMEEAIVKMGSSFIGKNLVESNLRNDYGVIIVLIKKSNGEMIFNPQSKEVLEENDVIVMLGKKEDMKRMGGTL